MQKSDLLLHPVRMRIILALAGRQLTTRQLAAVLPDVPQATLYHHLGLLATAGMLVIADEHRIRGTVEKVYALAENAGSLESVEDSVADRTALMRAFTTFVGTLLGDFARYLGREHIDMAADGAGFRQYPLYLSDDEFERLHAALSESLRAFAANEPAPGRTRRLVSTIIMPAPESTSATPVQPPER